ncbi:uncharacterized protein LOC124268955 isoform X1 [Haliotis rubra]|uniref:uncharacterized protein LOC124268955 isoform X1 n=1 Tax=Haliotis rubra TaxID=36100 RepID=UPI001EE4ED38|nr:uncharacterized protein LOC124268955 isoform X1 [Haliotis rubra]
MRNIISRNLTSRLKISMELRTIVFGLFVILPVTLSIDEDEVDGKTYKDTIEVKGVTCSFAEYKTNDGGGPRGLHLFSCKNGSLNMDNDCIYYGGNPHGCKKYKPNQQNSIKKYYTTLARSAMGTDEPCEPENITESLCDKFYVCIQGSCMNKQLTNFDDEL